MKDETKCLHSGYKPQNGGPGVMPIYQSTTFRFDSTAEIAEVFDDPTKAHIYSRFTNPTVDCVEKKIADLFSAQKDYEVQAELTGGKILVKKECFKI